MAIQSDFWPSYAYWKLDKTDFGEHREKGSTGIKNHPEMPSLDGAGRVRQRRYK